MWGNYYRLPDGCTDQDVSGDEPEEVGECEQCHNPIFAGDEVFDVGDGYVHDECLSEYARKRFDVVVAE